MRGEDCEEKGVLMQEELVEALPQSSGHVEQPPTMQTIAEQPRGIQNSLDILREQRYEDQNEVIAYINDLHFSEE